MHIATYIKLILFHCSQIKFPWLENNSILLQKALFKQSYIIPPINENFIKTLTYNNSTKKVLFHGRERIKIIDTKFSRPFPIPHKCMFSESACLKSNFGTYLEFLSPAVAEKFFGEVGQLGIFSHSQLYMVLLNSS
jgi:hypothetical protein